MKRALILFAAILITGLITGCAYLTKKDEPPPLPPIEDTKPPLKIKAENFKAFPWAALAKPRKDGNDPDTSTYTVKQGDTLESIAESMMGSAGLASGLADFNDLASASSVSAGDKIVIPNPIIGVSSQLMVKAQKEKEFGSPQSFDVEFKKGDQYKLRFEPNVDGHLYVFRQGAGGVSLLYPALAKTGKKTKKSEPLPRDTSKVTAHGAVEIPMGKQGFTYDSKKAGDRVFVFLSLRKIQALEDLKDKKSIRVEELEDVMHEVKEGEVVSEAPYHVLRISSPSALLGFVLNLNG